MKTSPSQFDFLVTFMEQHGDLSKPTNKAKGRLQNLQKWEELASALNSNGSGEAKTADKWKKVWSDLKNNTKKKAAKISRGASGTGGGPALLIKLSDLEQRVLQLMGTEAATGLDVGEAGLSQASDNRPASPAQYSQPRAEAPEAVPRTQTMSPVRAPVAEPQVEIVEVGTMSPVRLEWIQDQWVHQETGTLTRPDILVTDSVHQNNMQSPSRVHTPPPLPPPPITSQTTPQRRRRRAPASLLGSPASVSARPRTRLTNTDLAAQRFLRTDSEWRAFKMKAHEDKMARQREADQIRLLELDLQKNWQALMSKGLELLDRYFSK